MKKLLLVALLFIAGYSVNAQPTITFVNTSCIPVYTIIFAANPPYCPTCGTRLQTKSPTLIPIGTTTFSTPTSGGLTWSISTPSGMFTYFGVEISESSTFSSPCGGTNGIIGESWPGVCCSSSAFSQVCTTHCQPNINCSWSSGGPGTNVTVYIN